MKSYPYQVVIQFRNSGELGTANELDWRHKQEDHMDRVLKNHRIGMCDGGQSGAGSMEIFMFTNNVAKAVEVIKRDLTTRELIGFCKVASLDTLSGNWDIYYPPDETFFSLWEFDDSSKTTK